MILIKEQAWTIEKSDALPFLKNIPDASVDLCLSDPPYDALEKHRAVGTTTRLTKRWFPTLSHDKIAQVLRECYRVLKNKTHCYVMCNYEAVWGLKALIERETSFTVPKSLIWDKVSIGMGYNWRSQHEHILFCKKGKRPVNNKGWGDVLHFKRIHKGAYPTEKPVDLFRRLILQSTEERDLVLDPFCGSGASGLAAVEEGRHYLGCDIAEDAVQLTQTRLNDAFGKFAWQNLAP